MYLDLRYAIGLLLGIYGALLVIEGVVARPMVLGLNVDLWWGAAMAVFGLALLVLARVRRIR